jgi:hypothetical protein
MITNAETRYKNGLGKISAYYKAKASLGNIQNMRVELENEIVQKRITINTFMNRDKLLNFSIDTNYAVKDYSSAVFDSSLFYTNRSDLKAIDKNKTLSAMLAEGELDALVTARAPSTFKTTDSVKRLFPDYVEKEKQYYKRTKIFPIMHTVVIRRDVYAKNPWVAQSLYKAFVASKKIAADMYAQTAAMTSMLPWTSAHAEEARTEMGEDWWPYGLGPNRHVLETFLRYHHEQGLSKRLFKPEELFAKETLESFKV